VAVGVIGEEVAEFALGPVALLFGTVDETGVPDAARLCGVVRLDDRHLRALVPTAAATAWANAKVGAAASLLITDITNYRSRQFKGRVSDLPAETTRGDVAVFRQHVEAFNAGGRVVGLDPVACATFFPTEFRPLILEVDEVFDQTPGPGAGRKL
jgi:hypothetical protein